MDLLPPCPGLFSDSGSLCKYRQRISLVALLECIFFGKKTGPGPFYPDFRSNRDLTPVFRTTALPRPCPTQPAAGFLLAAFLFSLAAVAE
jgi:hypothetical protein